MEIYWVLRIGLLIVVIGGVWLYFMFFRSNYLWFFVILMVIGIGLGVIMIILIVSV